MTQNFETFLGSREDKRNIRTVGKGTVEIQLNAICNSDQSLFCGSPTQIRGEISTGSVAAENPLAAVGENDRYTRTHIFKCTGSGPQISCD